MLARFGALRARAASWREQSVNRRIFAAMLTVGGFSMMAKLMGATKDLVVAARFGTSDSLDAFLTAFVLPLFATQVISGSFNTALMPTFIRVRERDGHERAQRLLSNALAFSAGLLAVVALLLGLASPWILAALGSGFRPEKLAVTRTLFLTLLPILIVSGVSTTWAGVLNASERFALAAVAPILNPLVPMAALLVAGRGASLPALVGGTMVGYCAEAAVLGWRLRKLGYRLRPRWAGFTDELRQVIGQYLPMAMGALLMSGTALVDQGFAASLGSGRVSALSYGNKMVSFTVGIGALSLGTAVFPHYARMVAVRDWTGVRHTLRTYARLTLLLAIPGTAVLFFSSEPLIRLLFQRGAFSAADTHVVGQVQAYYLLQVPFYLVTTLMVRLLSSLGANHLLMIAAAINLFFNVLLDWLFMRWMGVAGIALSTACVYAISTTFVAVTLSRHLRRVEAERPPPA